MRILRTLALSLAMIAAQCGAVAKVPEPADQAGAALTSVPGGAQVRGSAATDASLRALNPWRYLAGSSLRAPAPGNQPEIPAGRRDGRGPGSWALLMAGLAGAVAIGRRRLSSIADRSIARRRRWR
ncbi:MAG TPA: hypothetical protein VKQ31_04505, partial [Steroidobacteraceae bacterium]|nr:hypothetical protein [Steroidobacteraceae bacterium]